MEVNKVKLYQAGGYATYQPLPVVPQEQPQSRAQQDAPEKKEEGLDQDILKKMIGEGITTDVLAYSKQVNDAYQRYSMMDDTMKNSYMGKQLRSMMKGDLGQLNALMRGKKLLDGSIEQAKSQEGLNEGAVTQDGQAVVKKMSTGEITTMSLGQLVKERGNRDSDYKVLTNAELAEEREYNPQLLGNSNVFAVIAYAKGIDKVKDEVLKVVSSIGQSSVSKATGAYGASEGGEDVAALQAAAANGAFKIKDGMTMSSNKPQIEAAKAALWNNLSESAKATLRLRATSLVNDPSKIEQAAYTLAASLLDPHLSENSKEVHDETLKKLTGAGGAGANKTAEIGEAEAAFLGRYNNVTVGIRGPHGESIQMAGDLLPSALTVGKDGKRTSLREAAALQGVSTGLDKAFVANGDKIKPENTVVTGNTYIAEVPVTLNAKGNLMLDEEGAKKMAAVEKAFAALPANDKTPENKQELMRKFGASNLNLQRMIIAEAASYSDHTAWFDGRDANYYDPADEATEKYVGEIVDPKETGPRRYSDNSLHKHLVFIPAGSQMQFRAADSNHAVWNQSAFDLHTYNTGPGGATVHNSVYSGPVSATPPVNAGKDYWK